MVVRLRTQHYTDGHSPPFVASVSGRNFLDQNGIPILVSGDSPQSLSVKLSTAQMDTFFASRQSHSINACVVDLISSSTTGGNDTSGSTYDSIVPFTGGDWSTPNETYWARMDTMFTTAATYGVTVFAFPAEYLGWASTAVAQGATKCTGYGTFLGNRYKNTPNVVWMFGNDFDNVSGHWATYRPYFLDILSGIRGTGDTHLASVQFLDPSTSWDDTNWNSSVSWVTAYDYFSTYNIVETAYNGGTKPAVMIEAGYEGETLHSTTGTRNQIRRQTGWSYLAGGVGCFYGHHNTWQFLSDWASFIDTGAQQDINRIVPFLRTLNWSALVPDQGTTFITSGRGTHSTNTIPTSDTYAGCARTADQLLAVCYFPTSRVFTLDTTLLTGTVTGYWWDPTNGSTVTYTGATHPGNNSVGDGDWFLVLNGS